MEDQSNLTNSNANDDPLDQALMDLVPIPPSTQDDMSSLDPDNPFSMF